MIPQPSELRIARRRRIDRHHGHGHPPVHYAPEHVARPKRARQILDQFALEFLPPEHRAAIARHHGAQKTLRQMLAVLRRRHPRDDCLRIGQQPLQQFRRPRRRRRDLPGPLAKPQTKLQHVPCGLGVGHLPISSHHAAANCGPRKRSGSAAPNIVPSTPFGQWSVVPRSLAARPVAIPPSARLALRPSRRWLGHRLADQRDRSHAGLGESPHPLGSGARLARPRPPISSQVTHSPSGGQLREPGPQRPVEIEFGSGGGRRPPGPAVLFSCA